MKKSLLLILPLTICFGHLLAQTTHKDSVTEIATADTKNFMLNKEDLQAFRRLGPKRRFSDYFKPKAANVSDIRLLKDSDYVQAYRHIAFIKTRKRHAAGHYILIIGSSIVGVILIATVIVLATGGINFDVY